MDDWRQGFGRYDANAAREAHQSVLPAFSLVIPELVPTRSGVTLARRP